jgi:hypothetical protein
MADVTFGVKIKTPRVPSYLQSNPEGMTFHVSDISDDDLRKIGEAWTVELIKHAQFCRLHGKPKP